MVNIVVLGGGTSDEREVSLRSSAEVLKAAESLGHHVAFIDPKNSKAYLELEPNTLVLPILHGHFGEDGKLQKQLEDKGIAFLGSDSISSRKCFDKWATRKVLTKNNIPMPDGDFIEQHQYYKHPLSQDKHVLKIVDGGSSIGTHIIRDPRLVEPRLIQEIFNQKKILIESCIEGIEITVPVLGEVALPVIEIIPPSDGEFDYDNKYNGKTEELCPPKNVDKPLQIKAQRLAEQVHKQMNCRHLSRVDIIIDDKGDMYVLEINTIPGLTAQSLYPKAAAQAGMNMEQLVQKFIDMVVDDYQMRLEKF